MRGEGPSRHSVWVAGVLVTALLTTAMGYIAGSRVRSPQEAAASARPPATSEIFVEVRKGSIQHRARFEGAVMWHKEFSVESATVGSAARPIVTRVPLAKNVGFEAGAVLLEIADRPVIALQGSVPMLRDLASGARGPDVTRLQEALADAGHYHGVVDGRFGALTEAALRSVYEAAGYTVPLRSGRGRENAAPRAPVALASELTFVPSLPGTLLSYPAGLGEEVEGAVATLGMGGLVVTTEMTADWLPALKQGGDRVRITIEGAGRRRLRGQVTGFSRPHLVDGERLVRVGLSPVVGRLRPGAFDAGVQVEISERKGPQGLKVPLSAIFVSAESGDFVRVLGGDGSIAVAPVQVKVTGNGSAIVEARQRGALAVGDRVAVGLAAP